MEFRFESMTFLSNFDSGNLATVTRVDKSSFLTSTSAKKQDNDFLAQQISSDYEFNLWTSPDAAGTPYVNANRTWFYFSVSGVPQFKIVKFNIMNLNKQGKLYSQGYAPMFKVKCFNNKVEKWERVKDRISYETVGSELILTFHHFFSEVEAITYFAFSYPWSYTDCQAKLEALDMKLLPLDYTFIMRPNMIYYHRELLVHSLDGLRVDLITISDHSGISNVEESRFDECLFPDKSQPRCKMFANKKVFFVSSRVHPGETPSSHVFNGFLDFILRKNDPRAEELRRRYVFKLIPLLNPDGVCRGYYRTDQHGVNLNRVYLDPTFSLYPSIYAVKSLLAYYHIGCDDYVWKTIIRDLGNCNVDSTASDDETYVKLLSKLEHKKDENDVLNAKANLLGSKEGPYAKSDCFSSVTNTDDKLLDSNQRQIHLLAISDMTSARDSCLVDSPSNINERFFTSADNAAVTTSSNSTSSKITDNDFFVNNIGQKVSTTPHLCHPFYLTIPPEKSGLAYYIDLHAHASKKGCFFYGNHFDDIDKQIQCRTYAKLVSMNTGHLDYDGCNFTERNMYTQDKRENLNKEGSARVAIFKHLGIVNSYTLECNYNTGRLTNLIPHASGDSGRATPPPSTGNIPQKYNISHFEEVGRALAISALDAEEANPWTRLTRSEFISLSGVRDWVKKQLFFEGLSMSSAPFNGMAHENFSTHRSSRVHKLSDSKTPQTSQFTSKHSNSSKHPNKTPLKVTPIHVTPHIFEIPNSSMLSTSPKSKAVKGSYKKFNTAPALKAVHPKSIELMTHMNGNKKNEKAKVTCTTYNERFKRNFDLHLSNPDPNRNNHAFQGYFSNPFFGKSNSVPTTSARENLRMFPDIDSVAKGIKRNSKTSKTVLPPLVSRNKNIKTQRKPNEKENDIKMKSKLSEDTIPSEESRCNYIWPNYSLTNQNRENRRREFQKTQLNPLFTQTEQRKFVDELKKKLLKNKKFNDVFNNLNSAGRSENYFHDYNGDNS